MSGTVKEYRYETRSGEALSLQFCGWEQCSSGHAFGPAVRTHFLFHFVISGRGAFEKAGKRWELTAGQGFLIFPGESTRYEADVEEPWEYCWVGFDGTDVLEILADCALTADDPIFTDKSGGNVGRELLHMVNCYSSPDNNKYAQLARLYRCFSHMVQNRNNKPQTAQEYVSRATDFIHINFGYEIGVAEIAAAVGIDRSYLYRIFRDKLGKPPKEYLTEFRLKVATEMLVGTGLSVTEIAFSCGFKEVSLFDKQFKAAYGCSPLKYRKNNKKQ